MILQEGPHFNLKAVVQQTGLKPDTLRAWERRYGLPAPRRSAGRHRLYSQRDIDTVKWLMARQREGLSISRAVELWQQIEVGGRDPLETPTPIALPGAPSPGPRPVGETLARLRREWLDACLAYDERRAEQVVAQAFALYPPETVAIDLLQRALALVGEGWHRGEITVQQEHFCSALAIRRVEALVMAAPSPTRPGRILAACPPQEDHVFGLLLFTFLLRRRGWDMVYLGANVPAERLEITVAAIGPQLVLLAAQQLHTAATLLEMARLLQQEDVPLAYGGLIFNRLPALRDRIPGHFLGERLDLALDMVETLLLTPRPLPVIEDIPEACRQAREHYRARATLIEARLLQIPAPAAIAACYLALANRELARRVDAALTLGDMNYLGTDVEWVKDLLANYRLPPDVLRDYLVAYHRAACDVLDERGAAVVAWLDRVTRKNGFHEM